MKNKILIASMLIILSPIAFSAEYTANPTTGLKMISNTDKNLTKKDLKAVKPLKADAQMHAKCRCGQACTCKGASIDGWREKVTGLMTIGVKVTCSKGTLGTVELGGDHMKCSTVPAPKTFNQPNYYCTNKDAKTHYMHVNSIECN